jgi:hypothetical protein
MRFASFILIDYPIVTRSFAALTIALAAFALWKQWKSHTSPPPVLSPARDS